MAIFLTGSTGYLGSYLAAGFFYRAFRFANLLCVAKSEQEARGPLVAIAATAFEFPEFRDFLAARVRIFAAI